MSMMISLLEAHFAPGEYGDRFDVDDASAADPGPHARADRQAAEMAMSGLSVVMGLMLMNKPSDGRIPRCRFEWRMFY